MSDQAPVAWLYITDVTNRFEEQEYTKDQAENMWKEKVLEIVPLYKRLDFINHISFS